MITKTHVKLFQDMENTLSFIEERYKGKFNFTEERNSLTLIGKLLTVLLKNGGVSMVETNKRKLWTDEEIKLLIKLAMEGKTLREQTKFIKRTEKAISKKRSKLGIKSNKWTNEDLKTLIMEISKGEKVEKIVDILNKPVPVIEIKIKALGLDNKELKAII